MEIIEYRTDPNVYNVLPFSSIPVGDNILTVWDDGKMRLYTVPKYAALVAAMTAPYKREVN